MNSGLYLFLILAMLYFLCDLYMSRRFKREYRKKEYFLGKEAPDDMQRIFGKAAYLSMFYYLLVLAHLASGFDYWGLISSISI